MNRQSKKNWAWYASIPLAAVAIIAILTGCQGPAGDKGPAGPAGPAGAAGAAGASSGTISGVITNSLTKKPLAGVSVAVDPAVKGQSVSSDANGAYSATVPVGTYTVNFTKANFTAATATVSVTSGQTISKDVAIKPVKPVAVNAGQAQTVAPGASVNLKATAEPLDGSTVKSYEWTQTAGVKATIDNSKTDAIKVTLAPMASYKAELLKGLPIEDRFMVQAINPHALSAAETATFKVTVSTSSGSYTATVNVLANLPYIINPGIENVAKGEPVLVHGKTQSSYSWSLAAPTGAKAALDSPSDQNPSFTPDAVGKYTLTEKTSGANIDVYAGTWVGAITGQDAKGRPVSAGCTSCHNGKAAPDNFTAWKESGHAEILTQNINNPAGHWSESCASCHTVGYDKDAANGGFDEALAAEGWKIPAHGDVGLWTELLAKYPKTAKLANIQCENCHGPNDSPLHMNGTIDAARVSISAEACGSCHGEPPRHGRYQQWEESGHANVELAIEEATVEARGTSAAHCGRCHAGEGFLAWIQQSDLTKQIQGKNGNATVEELTNLGLTKDTVHSQTCVVCHDPHEQGTLSGKPNTATVRITGDTPKLPAGFKATQVGQGAICMTCHNTRNGLHNDANAPTSYSAPHTAAQADVLMGENAYFVPAQRSAHSYIDNTCVTCHMDKSPPPPEFSLNAGGTNHAFNASINVCSSCHSNANGKAVQAGIEEKLEALASSMSSYLLNKMPANVTILEYTPHDYNGKSYEVKSSAVQVDKTNIASVELAEVHGQESFILNLKSPIAVTYTPAGQTAHTLQITKLQVQLGDITTDGTAKLIATSDVLVKAAWNYYLIEGDGSEGVHNPSFAREVLEASINALK